MKFLLDTHVMLWWLRDNPKLGPLARAAIADPAANPLVSIASFWEFSIKARVGKFDESGARLLREAVDEGFGVLGVERPHLAALENLARQPGHNDPFDHLILAQAGAEGATVITNDKLMTLYGVPCIPAMR